MFSKVNPENVHDFDGDADETSALPYVNALDTGGDTGVHQGITRTLTPPPVWWGGS